MDKKQQSPKHGSSPESNVEPQKQKSVSQADGTAAQDPKGETQAQPDSSAQRNSAQPSGSNAQNPATAGPGNTTVQGQTPEARENKLNPSAPNQSTGDQGGNRAGQSAELNSTPAPVKKDYPATMDSAGEIGDNSGKGNMQFGEKVNPAQGTHDSQVQDATRNHSSQQELDQQKAKNKARNEPEEFQGERTPAAKDEEAA